MKRIRTSDIPKHRRSNMKNRTRFSESVYFRCFSPYNLIYLKFFAVWVGCIALDCLVGFRFELLWPVWLLIRHLSESFRAHAFSSSLQYSAYSVLFICFTATSDLVCYLFIPVQVLIFIASTFVWFQFIYSSTERGVCLPSLFLWALFIVFELCVRCRFDNNTWYLTRGSWMTAGLFPSTADTLSVGGASTPGGSGPSPRLELYRPFAAHCIGFPIVTLGFRVKSLLNKWKLRMRREEVIRQNEFLERVLAEAVPQSFDDRRHFISTRHYLSTAEQESIAYEQFGLEGAKGDSPPITMPIPLAEVNRLYSQLPSSSYSLSPSTATTERQLISGACAPSNTTPQSVGGSRKGAQRVNKAGPSCSSGGGLAHRRNGNGSAPNGTLPTNKVAANGTAVAKCRGSTKQGTSNMRLWRYILVRVFSLLQRVVCNCYTRHYFSTTMHFLSELWAGDRLPLSDYHKPSLQPYSHHSHHHQQDDLISSTGDGSHLGMMDEEDYDSGGEDEEPDGEGDAEEQYNTTTSSTATAPLSLSTPMTSSTASAKKKGRRTRGRTPLDPPADTSTSTIVGPNPFANLANLTQNGHHNHPPQGNGHYHPLNSEEANDPNRYYSMLCNGNGKGDVSTAPNTNNSLQLKQQLGQVQKANEALEQSMERLRVEAKTLKGVEGELRAQLQHSQQQNQSARNELGQSKAKVEQLEGKCRNLAKQGDAYKASIAALEKRVGELQVKRMELERELVSASERSGTTKQQQQSGVVDGNGVKAGGDPSQHYHSTAPDTPNMDFHTKMRMANMERELKALKRELRIKDEAALRMEGELRQMGRHTDDDAVGRQLELLQQKNYELEQTLSSENRLKQDLFRALNDSKAQIEALNVRLGAAGPRREGTAAQEDGGSLSVGSSPCGPPPPPSYAASQKSFTPPPLAAINSINLDQLMQVTGTKNMTYSFGPFSPLENGSGGGTGAGADAVPTYERNNNAGMDFQTIGSRRTPASSISCAAATSSINPNPNSTNTASATATTNNLVNSAVTSSRRN